MKIIVEEKLKPKILAALYNNSKPLGMGIMHFDPTLMVEKEAERILKSQTYFDYLKGRVMKLDFATNQIDTCLYDRDNGDGSCERIINGIINKTYTIYGEKVSNGK